jgi:hypothetical protein
MSTDVKWAAQLARVREVSLLGTADLAYWEDRLRRENLVPAERDGQAQLLIIATDSKYMGVRFRELSFSVLVSWSEVGIPRDAAYLVRAFNSFRFFAFCERVFFSTPYDHGDVGVSASLPASMRLLNQREVLFRAEMGADGSGADREPSRRGPDGWEGPIFLPKNQRGTGRPGKWFFARLSGETRIYPFVPSQDALEIERSPASDVLLALRDSHFVAKEWIIREDASHAKSKTYTRPNLLQGATRADAAEPRAVEPDAAPDGGHP